MDEWYTNEYDYLWYTKNLRQRTTLVIANCEYKVVLAAFIRTYREKLVEDGIWIYPEEARETVPVGLIAAMPLSRRSTDSDGESLVCWWGSRFEKYKLAAIRNPLTFANEHEDLAVEFLTALAEEMETSCHAPSYAKDIETYRRRIEEIESKPGYVQMELPEDFCDFRKWKEFYDSFETKDDEEEKEVTAKKTTVMEPEQERPVLPLDEIREKVSHFFPIKEDDPCLLPAEKGVAAKKAKKSEHTLRNQRCNREMIPIGDDFLSVDEKGRVFFKKGSNGRVFYYDLTIKVGSESFEAFHQPVKNK